MDGTPPALPGDSEDVAWALQTAEALWKRGERVDAVVWVRRAAQAAGEGEDAKRAASLARKAAELGDWIGSHSLTGDSARPRRGQSASSLEALDSLLGDAPSIRESSDDFVLSSKDVEVVSAADFEAGFAAPPPPPPPRTRAPSAEPKPSSPPQHPSDGEVMTVSVHAPDVEIIEEGVTSEEFPEFPEEEPTPVLRHPRSPPPPGDVPSAAQAHAGMLDPWAEEAKARESKAQAAAAAAAPPGGGRRGAPVPRFDEDEVVTSAKRNAGQAPAGETPGGEASFPPAPRAPRFPAPRGRAAAAPPPAEEADTTTYRQINPRGGRPERERPAPDEVEARVDPRADDREEPESTPEGSPAKAPARPGPPPLRSPGKEPPPRLDAKPKPPKPAAKPSSKPTAKPAPVKPRELPPEPAAQTRPPTPTRPVSAHPKDKSLPPALDLLEMVDAVALPSDPAPPRLQETPRPSVVLTPRPAAAAVTSAPLAASARPTAPPPSEMPAGAVPSAPPTRPRGAATLLDLGAVEALGDLPDDAREAFGRAATLHEIGVEEEVSHFALALVVEGTIDVSATIVDAPALRLERNAILRSRGTLVPGVSLRLVCASAKATVATWDDAAVEAAFRTCPWVEEDLRAVADRVQAKVGLTMGPLGERFDFALREHMTSKLTIRSLSPGEVLVAEGKPVPIAIVGVGEIVLTKNGVRTETLRPGDFLFPTQTLAHAAAPATAAAGEGGAVVLYGDRAVSQELLMSFPPLLEVLATL